MKPRLIPSRSDANRLIAVATGMPPGFAIEDLDNPPAYSKVGLGKLAMSRPLYPEFARLLQEHGFQQLAISYRHASEVARLPWHHRDPFDRLLIAPGVGREPPHRQRRHRVRRLRRYPPLVALPRPPRAVGRDDGATTCPTP